MSAEEVYALTLEWAKENDRDFADCLEAHPEMATAALAIGRGGKKPRKDIAIWSEVKGYMGFLFDEYYEILDSLDSCKKEDVAKALLAFAEVYSPDDDNSAWFEKVKAIATDMGYATDMKAYKADPDAFPGSVADISAFIRLAITGKLNSPDLCELMKILGKEKSVARLTKTAALFA